MQNLKSAVYSALTTYTAVTSLVSDRTFFHFPDDFNTLPCISYFEFNNAGEFFVDDLEAGSEIIFQIDIWASGSTTAIAQAVDTTMVDIGFVRIRAADRYKKETGIHQKTMLYVNHYFV